MGITKDKRIKKLGKKRIWPSILGLFIIMFFMSIMMAATVSLTCIDIMQRKIMAACVQTEKVTNVYADYDDKNASQINDTMMSFMEWTPEIEEVCLMDKTGEAFWTSSGKTVNVDLKHSSHFKYSDEIDMDIIIDEASKDLVSVEDGAFTISDKFVRDVFEKMFYDVELDGLKSTWNTLTEINIWIAVPSEDFTVCVLNKIPLQYQDVISLVLSLGMFLVIAIIFTIYYLISFLSMIFSVRRTTRMLYTDMITGGNNWLYFIKKGNSLLKKNRGNKKRYVMIHLRMQKYRSFCTCFGVQEGELLLEKFYLTLKKQVKGKEVMAYHENADFGLLLTYTDEAQLSQRMETIKSALCTSLPNMKLYFSVGACLVATGEKDVEKLYNNAILACEIRGEDAENQIAFFDVEMNKQKLWEHKVEDDMDRALLNKEFKVYLQPKISATNEVLAGAEALVRWSHPTEGFIPPGKFIPIFERNGFILKLDDYMLEEVARLQAQWIAEGRKIVPISVNVSRAHFSREDLAEHICGIVDKYKVPHDVIELELTESAFFEEKELLLNTVRKLRESGFAVSMDDFGAGYSSLNSLKELQLDVLKIDVDFFRGDNVEERGMLIVSEVIDLAKKLNMKIVAEGIESREQVDFLIEQECDLIQGYFFAKPMAIEEFVTKY